MGGETERIPSAHGPVTQTAGLLYRRLPSRQRHAGQRPATQQTGRSALHTGFELQMIRRRAKAEQ